MLSKSDYIRYIQCKKLLIIVVVAVLSLLVFVLLSRFQDKDVAKEPVSEENTDVVWTGADLSCSNFSCLNSEKSAGKSNREFAAYHPCLVKCTDEYQMFESGQFGAIVPAGYELLAQEHLQDLQYCFPLLKEQLGLTPFYNKVYVVFPLAQESKAYAATSFSSIYYYRMKDQLDSAQNSFKKRSDEGLNSGIGPDRCINAHEFTHIFASELHLPRWANEGIATYMTTQMPDVKDNPSYCADDGLRFKSVKGENFVPYSDLSKSLGDVEESNENYLYETGSCVFDYIAKNYGQDKIKLIVKKFAEYAANNEPDEKIGKGLDRFSSKVFIEEGIVPAVGEEIKADLKKMFNL